MSGGEGDDELYGDNWFSATPDEQYHLPAGNDDMFGGNGNDFLFGNDGTDALYGGNGNDYLAGTLGSDYVYGGNGDDRISGYEGDYSPDHAFGGSGNDTVEGAGGDDDLYGGDGNDDMLGWSGLDDMAGGSGSDRFYFTSSAGTGLGLGNRDRVLDFDAFEGDRLGVATIYEEEIDGDAGSFELVYENAFTAAGQLRYANFAGYTVVEGNTGGSLAADFQIELVGYTGELSVTDFIGAFVNPPPFDPDLPVGF
jgi:Ca2+-binding RTX toxin-like protein